MDKNADEYFATARGHAIYLSGGAPDGHKGVGFVICNQIRSQLSNIILRAIHCRLCILDFSSDIWNLLCIVRLRMPWTDAGAVPKRHARLCISEPDPGPQNEVVMGSAAFEAK